MHDTWEYTEMSNSNRWLKQGLKHQLRKRALGTPGWEMQVVEGGQGKYGKQGSVCYIDIQSVLSPLMNLL